MPRGEAATRDRPGPKAGVNGRARRAGPRQRSDPDSGSAAPRRRFSLPVQRVVTAALEGDLLRLVAFEGNKVVAWDVVDLAGSGPLRAPRRFRAERRRSITDMPLESTLLRFLSLPRVKRKYLEPMLMAEVAGTLPFSASEVDITWSYRRRAQGFESRAVAVPGAAMDERLRRLGGVGLTPGRVFSRAAALACVAGFDSAIVAHVTATGLEMVLVEGGSPRAVHLMALPEGPDQTKAEAIAAVADQLSATLEQRNGAPVQRLPLVVTGRGGTLAGEIGRATSRPVAGVSSPFRQPADFPIDEFAANIGLALAGRLEAPARKAARTAAWAPLNLVPARHKPRARLAKPLAVLGVLAALGFAAYAATGPVNDLSAEATALEPQVAGLSREERLQRLQAGRLGALEELGRDLGARAQAVEAVPVALRADLEALAERIVALQDIARALDVELGVLAADQRGFTLGGSAPSFAGVSAYAGELRATALFDDVRVIVADTGAVAAGAGTSAIPTVEFQMKATASALVTE